MGKFITWNFASVILFSAIMFIAHEYGHYFAYRILGYQAVVRKSIFAPGIDPKETIEIPRWQGILIAFSGFLFSTVIAVLPLFLLRYQYWFVLLIGGVAGSSFDAIWSISLLGRKTLVIHARE